MATIYKTFDDIYTAFMDITRVDEFMLPQTPEGKYALLEQGIYNYSIYFDNAKDIDFDRETEELTCITDIEISDVLLIINYMKLIILKKINEEFISTYDVLVDDIGIRNYKSQADAKRTAVNEQQIYINNMILKLSDDFDYDD